MKQAPKQKHNESHDTDLTVIWLLALLQLSQLQNQEQTL